MKTYRIRPLLLTLIEIDMSSLTYLFNYGRKLRAPIVCWYIEGADQHILVDTAAEAAMAMRLRGFPAEARASFETALAGIGLKPEDIDVVVQTHLHWDHCGNTSRCKNARVIVAEKELKYALAPHPISRHLYYPELFEGVKFEPVNGRQQIAPGIEVIPAPGHTPGTQAVSINTAKGRAIISGFCSLAENFNPPQAIRKTMPVLAPGTHVNAAQAFDSALKIKEMADILIPQHEPAFAEMKSIPSD